MDSLKKYNKLSEFVKLFWLHKKEIIRSMSQYHPINKYKDPSKLGSIISTAELCIIMTLSNNSIAKKFCFSFGMESAKYSEFEKMLDKLKKHDFSKVADELKKREALPYIDIQHSTNLLRAKSKRDRSNSYIYTDYKQFIDYQFLQGTAKGYEVDWKLLEKAIISIDDTLVKGSNATIKDEVDREQRNIEFDPLRIEDEREKQLAEITKRQGQPEFRDKLLKAYNNKCAVTECDAIEALEAAHIVPYLGKNTNFVSNGILLRADIHTLFDRGLLSFDHIPNSENDNYYEVIISKEISNSTYHKLEGNPLSLPDDPNDFPDKSAMKYHYNSIFKDNKSKDE